MTIIYNNVKQTRKNQLMVASIGQMFGICFKRFIIDVY